MYLPLPSHASQPFPPHAPQPVTPAPSQLVHVTNALIPLGIVLTFLNCSNKLTI